MKGLVQELKQFYIPPLAKLYYERIALEKIVFKAPLFVRVSDPESWLVQASYQKIKHYSDEQVLEYLKNMIAYLSIDDEGSVFEGDKILTLNESIPYIEWQVQNRLAASTDLLGKYAFFIDLLEFDNEFDVLNKVINELRMLLGDAISFILIGPSEMHIDFSDYRRLIFIDPNKTNHRSFSERFRFKNKSGLTLFNFSSRPYFLVNPQGKLITFFAKQECQALIDDVQKYIHLDQ